MSGKTELAQRNLAGKVYDPVFLCMIGAIVLAVGTSVALRAMVGDGAAAARADDTVPVPHVQRPAVVHPANP